MTASGTRSILPPLSPEEARHSAAVAALIHAEMAAAAGWLSFERFMELALYAPGLGYYSAGSFKIGAGGDFVTAPEVSDLFGRCLARQCAEVLAVTGGEILELGAGSGRMAATLLTALAAQGRLPQRYAILEVSADASLARACRDASAAAYCSRNASGSARSPSPAPSPGATPNSRTSSARHVKRRHGRASATSLARISPWRGRSGSRSSHTTRSRSPGGNCARRARWRAARSALTSRIA